MALTVTFNLHIWKLEKHDKPPVWRIRQLLIQDHNDLIQKLDTESGEPQFSEFPSFSRVFNVSVQAPQWTILLTVLYHIQSDANLQPEDDPKPYTCKCWSSPSNGQIQCAMVRRQTPFKSHFTTRITRSAIGICWKYCRWVHETVAKTHWCNVEWKAFSQGVNVVWKYC